MQVGNVDISEDICFIAEVGINHNGDIDMAKELVDAAVAAGVDAVKFQTFSTDRLVTETASTAEYQQEQDSQYEMLSGVELSRGDHFALQEYCADQGIEFLSTPFDTHSLSLLDELDVRAIKLGSGELNNKPLLQDAASLGRPLIISTGMGTMDEVRTAYEWVRDVDESLPVAFLHCVSAYPTPVEEVNLRSMQAMDDTLPTPIGFSDHTTSVVTPGLAVAAGADIVEKHLTLDKTLPGPDHEASLEPQELEEAVENARFARAARGCPEKAPTQSERSNAAVIRKSLHATSNLSAGTILEESDVRILRPAEGLPPARFDDVVGTRLNQSLEKGDPITDAVLEDH